MQVERSTVNDPLISSHGRRLSDAALVTWLGPEGWVIHRLSMTFEITGESMRVPFIRSGGVPTVLGLQGALGALAEVDWKRLRIRRCWVEIPPGFTVMHAIRVPELASERAKKVVWGYHLSEALPHAEESMEWSMAYLQGDTLESTLAVAGIGSEMLDAARLIPDLTVEFYVSDTLDIAAEWNRAVKSVVSVWSIGSGGLTVFGMAQGHAILRHFPMDRLGWIEDESGQCLPGPDAGEKLLRVMSRLGSSGVPATAGDILLCGEASLVSRLQDVVGSALEGDVRVESRMRRDGLPGRGVMEAMPRWARGNRLGLIGGCPGAECRTKVSGWRKSCAVALAMVIGGTAIVAGAMAYFKTEQLWRLRSEHAKLTVQLQERDHFSVGESRQENAFDPAQAQRIWRAEAVRDIPVVWVSVFSHLQKALQEVGDVWLDRFDLALSEGCSQKSGNDNAQKNGVIRLTGCMLVREANLRYPVDRQVVVRTKARLERLRSTILSDMQIAGMDGFSANFEGLDQGLNVVGFEMLLRLKTTQPITVDESR